MPHRILVTGGGGFIGAAVSRRLLAQGHIVRATSRNPAGLAKTFPEPALTPEPNAGSQAWEPLLAGVTHVVHCAGVAHASADLPMSAYWAANAILTGELAAAAASCIPGKLVFLSSIRAVTGPVSPTLVTGATLPVPQDDYGRSKLEGERLVRAALGGTRRFTILRPVLVYGPGMKGNLPALLRLARFPFPLPLAGLSAKRSLLDLDALVSAVEHSLASVRTDGGAFLVSDRDPVSTAEIVAAFRRGLDRRPAFFTAPSALLSALATTGGHTHSWRRLSGPLVADPSDLAATGWVPVEDSRAGLEELARNANGTQS